MTTLVVRRLLVDLETPLPRHWNGGDAFRSAYFNALSMSFPVGEQFFIDSVRDGIKTLPPAQQDQFAEEVRGFVGQEATHRRIHGLFNGHLERLGYTNSWEPRIVRRLKMLKYFKDPRHAVAITAAIEHFTAILAKHLLEHPQVMAGSEARLQTLWLWHAAEESEHRNTAFDVYRAMGGSEKWRRRWFRFVTFHFLVDAFRQTSRNLWHDGELLHWRTWKSAARFFFGKHGVARHTFKPWCAYFSADFHPSHQDASAGTAWLRDNATAYTAVARAAPATAPDAQAVV